MLRAKDLTFGYRRNRMAVNGLSWDIAPGTKTVLLGPNGAGKSTIMAMLCGSLQPRSGDISLDGRPGAPRQLARAVARMPQHVSAVPRLTCAEQVAYSAWLGGSTESESRRRAGPALDSVGLGEERHSRASSLSGGQLRRLGLAETLVRGTGYALLDEPTAGLDPQERVRFREVLAAVDDVAFVVATHETHDISAVFDMVCVMRQGRFAYVGTIDELLETTSSATLEDAYISLMSEHVR